MKESATQWSVMHAKIQMYYTITISLVSNYHSLVMITPLQLQLLQLPLLLMVAERKINAQPIQIVRMGFHAKIKSVLINVLLPCVLLVHNV